MGSCQWFLLAQIPVARVVNDNIPRMESKLGIWATILIHSNSVELKPQTSHKRDYKLMLTSPTETLFKPISTKNQYSRATDLSLYEEL